jgi:hypothetical protein
MLFISRLIFLSLQNLTQFLQDAYREHERVAKTEIFGTQLLRTTEYLLWICRIFVCTSILIDL